MSLIRSLPSIHYNSRRLFQTSVTPCNVAWTQNYLRRKRKDELMTLAESNNLNLREGTKNDYIKQLLAYQKIAGTSSAPQCTEDTSNVLPKITLETTEISENDATAQNGLNATPVKSSDDILDDTTVDSCWVDAFSAKVAQRGSRKLPSDNKQHFKPSNENEKKIRLFKKQVPIPSETINKSVETTTSATHKSITAAVHEKDTETLDDEINTQWVEAFDMKLESRQAERHLTDTLSATPKQITPIINIEMIKEAQAPSTESISKDQAQKEKSNNVSSINISKENTKSYGKQDTDNKFISTVIGSGLLLWYLGGEEGLSKIGHFFGSS